MKPQTLAATFHTSVPPTAEYALGHVHHAVDRPARTGADVVGHGALMNRASGAQTQADLVGLIIGSAK
jgi:hypothetical protein